MAKHWSVGTSMVICAALSIGFVVICVAVAVYGALHGG